MVINIKRKRNEKIKVSQLHLIYQILKDFNIDNENVKIMDIPCMSTKILVISIKVVPFDNSFHYRSITGKLNYLEKDTRSDISYIPHQCARLASDP